MLRPERVPGGNLSDQAEVTQQPQLVGHRRLLHAYRLGQLRDRSRSLPQFGEDQQPAGGGQGLQCGCHMRGGLGVQPYDRPVPAFHAVSHGYGV